MNLHSAKAMCSLTLADSLHWDVYHFATGPFNVPIQPKLEDGSGLDALSVSRTTGADRTQGHRSLHGSVFRYRFASSASVKRVCLLAGAPLPFPFFSFFGK